MKVPLVDRALAPAGDIEVSDDFYARQWNSVLAHRLVVSQAANRRQANSKQLTRGEVSHSTRKLGRQKGRGAARVGMSSSPIRRGGALAFPNRANENFSHKVNRREFRVAMSTIVSQLVRENRLSVAVDLVADEPKTKPMASCIGAFAPDSRVLFVDTSFDNNFALATRNLPVVKLSLLSSLLAKDMFKHERMVLSQRAVDKITTIWAGAQ